MGKPLEGRTALVTGGGRGIGAAVARALAAAGAAVGVASRTQAETDRVAAEVLAAGGSARAFRCDVTQEAEVRRLGTEARAALGRVDVLVLSAGIAASAPVRSITVEEWDRMMSVNARSAFLCAREFVPDMSVHGWGRAVAIASVAGLAGGKYIAHYAASKHAVIGLVRSLALEVEGTGVTVNAVCPGYVDTPMTERTLANVEARAGLGRNEALAAVLATTGQERLLAPEEVAAEVLRLCGDDAGGVNGRAIVIGAEAPAP